MRKDRCCFTGYILLLLTQIQIQFHVTMNTQLEVSYSHAFSHEQKWTLNQGRQLQFKQSVNIKSLYK